MARSKTNSQQADYGRHTDASIAWTAVPTLANSWADVAGAQAAQYRRTPSGDVELRGIIDSGTKTAATTITTLPVGCRPAANQRFPACINATTTDYVGTITVSTAGVVAVGAQTWQASSSASLDAVRFSAA